MEHRYRRCTKGNPDEWCLTTITINERERGRPKTAVVTVRSIDKIIKEDEERRQGYMARTLANMSDAFFIYRAMKDEDILYVNPAVMELYGCESMMEFMDLVGHSLRGMVHPEDLNRVEWEVEEQIRESDENMDYVQYRIIRRDGRSAGWRTTATWRPPNGARSTGCSMCSSRISPTSSPSPNSKSFWMPTVFTRTATPLFMTGPRTEYRFGYRGPRARSIRSFPTIQQKNGKTPKYRGNFIDNIYSVGP